MPVTLVRATDTANYTLRDIAAMTGRILGPSWRDEPLRTRDATPNDS